jgi:hypothetical protein
MKEEINSINEDTGRRLRFLLCNIAGGIADPSSPEEEWVASPIQCIDKAIDWKPEIIVVSFGQMPIGDREALIELCTTLKRNSQIKQCPVVALLHSKHRKLIEDLERSGVDYVRYIGDAKLSSSMVREIIEDLRPGDRLEQRMEMLCPFLHYSKIDSQYEMTVCGAYLDRMVLGGHRLHDLCETEDHLQCEYYLNPRRKS